MKTRVISAVSWSSHYRNEDSNWSQMRSNMKAKAISAWDKVMLSKRFIIEAVNGQLKNIWQLEHSRHRSLRGMALTVLGALTAYSHKEKSHQFLLTNSCLKLNSGYYKEFLNFNFRYPYVKYENNVVINGVSLILGDLIFANNILIARSFFINRGYIYDICEKLFL